MRRMIRAAPAKTCFISREHGFRRCLVTFIALTALTLTPIAQDRDRSKIADRYTWSLADIYPSDAAWRAAKAKLEAELPQLRQYRGTLTSSARTLADALDKQSAMDKELSRLYTYASLLADQDTRDAEHQGMVQSMAPL